LHARQLVAAMHDEIGVCKEQGHLLARVQRAVQAPCERGRIGAGDREAGDGNGGFCRGFLYQH
jgi:hypothetical protein